MSFVDSLMDMLKNGKEEDGAATARNNLSQTWDYPSLVAALPYRYYDDRNEIFVNAGSAGFIMEAAPLPGANEQVMAALDDMLRKKLPRQTPVTVIMLASKCVGERIDRGVSNDMWKGGWPITSIKLPARSGSVPRCTAWPTNGNTRSTCVTTVSLLSTVSPLSALPRCSG
jgi:conjugal transfer ATP-binding protein TraC